MTFGVNRTLTFPYLAVLSPSPQPTLQLNTQGPFLSLSLHFQRARRGEKKKAMLSSVTFSALCLRWCLGPRAVHEVFFLANPPINADVLENQRIGTVVQDFRSAPERPSGFVRSE